MSREVPRIRRTDSAHTEFDDEVRRKSYRPRVAKPIARVMADLLARRGYGDEQGQQSLSEAWAAAVGPLASRSQATAIKRGVLQVAVSSSAAAQELTFQKRQILAKIKDSLGAELRDVKFFVAPLGRS